MAPTLFDEKPEVGDLIEIFRGTYQHWAVYIGDGCVIHVAPSSEEARGGSFSMMSVMSDRALIKKEELWDVVGMNKYRINNRLDDKYEPRPAHVIQREAQRMLGREVPFCVLQGNCEHFATELRYGKAESRQVNRAVEVGVGVGVAAVVGMGILAAAAALFGSGSKEKRNKH